MNMCNHSSKPWGYNPFGENKKPTLEEIKEYKLYKCSDCECWFSLLPREKQ